MEPIQLSPIPVSRHSGCSLPTSVTLLQHSFYFLKAQHRFLCSGLLPMLPPEEMQVASKRTQMVGRIPRRAWRGILRVAVLAVLVPVLLQWVIAYLVGSDARILPPELLAAKNLLLVTAHPDDECLFFSPSILGVLDRNRAIKGGLLVMSTGELQRGPTAGSPASQLTQHTR